MLQTEYNRIAKTVDYVSDKQARKIIGAILEKVKKEFGAMIVDVWVRVSGRDGVDILQPYLQKFDPPRPELTPIALTPTATSLLVWVAEKRKSVWLERLGEKPTSAVDQFSKETITGRYMEADHRTRSYAAVPMWYRGQFRGILAVESTIPGGINASHVASLEALGEPTAILIWKSGFFEVNRTQTEGEIEAFCSTCSDLVSSPLNPYRTGFIARPFDRETEFLARALKDVFSVERIRAADYSHVPGSGLVLGELLPQIHSAHFGIADITGLNHNVLIELGAMLIINKPVVLLRRKADDSLPPFNITHHQIYTYELTETASTIGSSIKVSDPTSSRFLDDFVRTFVREKLMPNRMFQEAKEWVSD